MVRTYLVIALSLWSSASAVAGDVREITIERINFERTKAGLAKVTYNTKLQAAAQAHAEWMARTGKMTHMQGEKPIGNSREVWANSAWHPINRAIQAGYLDLDNLSAPDANDHVGEVIAHGDASSGPDRFRPQAIVAGWMRSDGHRKTLLGAFQDIGIGVMINEHGGVFWCAVLGKPQRRTTR